MSAKKYRDFLKEANLDKFDEGKLVSDWPSILKLITDKIQSKLGKEYKKNPERGIAMINTIGSMVGAKVTDWQNKKPVEKMYCIIIISETNRIRSCFDKQVRNSTSQV